DRQGAHGAGNAEDREAELLPVDRGVPADGDGSGAGARRPLGTHHVGSHRDPQRAGSHEALSAGRMTYPEFNDFCRSLPATTYVVQWGGSHVWKVGGKVFAIGG